VACVVGVVCVVVVVGVVVMAVTFICAGNGPLPAGPPPGAWGLRPILPEPVTCICALTDTTGVRRVTPRVAAGRLSGASRRALLVAFRYGAGNFGEDTKFG
jgi:hypothetical protein